MAVAEASFSTSTDSMADGLMVANPCAPRTSSLNCGNPSITYNGSLPPAIDETLRTRTLMPAPGCPDVCCTCTPASRPDTACSTLTTGISRSFSLRIEDTAPVSSVFRWVPYPTTTTSESPRASSFNCNSTGTPAVASSSFFSKPTEENTSTTLSPGAEIVNEPSLAVAVTVLLFLI